MVHYNCYVLGPDKRITSRHELEAADDGEAMLKASQVVEPSEVVPTIEVWTGARLVGVLRIEDPNEK